MHFELGVLLAHFLHIDDTSSDLFELLLSDFGVNHVYIEGSLAAQLERSDLFGLICICLQEWLRFADLFCVTLWIRPTTIH